MVVYLDVVFFENLLINLVLLICVQIILKERMKVFRGGIAAGIGALCSIMLYMKSFDLFQGLLIKMILSFVMIYIAYNAKNIKVYLKQVLVFYFVSFVFAGIAYSMIEMNFDETIKKYTIEQIGMRDILLKTIFIGLVLVLYVFKAVKR